MPEKPLSGSNSRPLRLSRNEAAFLKRYAAGRPPANLVSGDLARIGESLCTYGFLFVIERNGKGRRFAITEAGRTHANS